MTHETPVVRRRCDDEFHSHLPHAWERLNPATWQPYRRGRVVFMCSWWGRGWRTPTHRGRPETP